MRTETEYRITELLNSFFEGTTSPEEETELESLVSEADRIPESLRADCDAFLLCREPGKIEVPAGMLERLESAIDKQAKAEIAVRAKSRLRRYSIASVAAAAVIALALLIPALRQGGKQTPSNETIIAQATPEQRVYEATEKIDSVNLPQEEAPSEAEQKPAVRKRKPSRPATTPTRVVDNPQEAAMYLAQALGRVSKSQQTADTHISDCNRQIERATRLLNEVGTRVKSGENNPA